MKERMTRYERIQAAMNLEEADRVPVAPVNCYIIPYLSGLSIREMFHDPEKLIRATVDCLDIIGDAIDPNVTTLDHLSLLGKSGWDQVTLDWRIWDDLRKTFNSMPDAGGPKSRAEASHQSLKVLGGRAYEYMNPADFGNLLGQ